MKKQTNERTINFLDDKNILAYIFQLGKRKKYNKLNIDFDYLFHHQLAVKSIEYNILY